MKVNYNGYYITKGETHKDRISGGIEIEKILYNYLKFNKDGTFVKTIFDSPDYDFEKFILKKSEEDLLRDTSIPYGNYYLKENNKVELKYTLMDKWDMKFELEIISLKLLKDQEGILYYFKEI